MRPSQNPPIHPRAKPTNPYPTARIPAAPVVIERDGTRSRTGLAVSMCFRTPGAGDRAASGIRLLQVERAAFPDRVVVFPVPAPSGRAAEVLQLLEEAPLGVEPRGGGVFVKPPSAMDAMHVDALVLES